MLSTSQRHHTNPLVESISFRDEISQPTEFRPEPASISASPVEESAAAVNPFDFEETASRIPQTPSAAAPEPIVDEYEDYDAETNAKSLVHMLTALDSIALTVTVNAKCRKNVGGQRAIKKMRAALIKSEFGQELTETDKQLIKRFEAFEAKLKLLSDDVLPKPEKIDQLIQQAIPYCEASRIKVGEGTGFWISYGTDVLLRASKILLA